MLPRARGLVKARAHQNKGTTRYLDTQFHAFPVPLWVAERLGEGSRGFQPTDCAIHHETSVAERRLKPGMTRRRPTTSSVAPRRNPSIICQTVG
jgi:hypothetical protein